MVSYHAVCFELVFPKRIILDLKSEREILKFVINKDNADLASTSASSFPGLLMLLGSQQDLISFVADR